MILLCAELQILTYCKACIAVLCYNITRSHQKYTDILVVPFCSSDPAICHSPKDQAQWQPQLSIYYWHQKKCWHLQTSPQFNSFETHNDVWKNWVANKKPINYSHTLLLGVACCSWWGFACFASGEQREKDGSLSQINLWSTKKGHIRVAW